MVANADWDTVQFEVPFSLASFESRETIGTASRREVLNSNRFGGIQIAGRETCASIYRGLSPLMQPHLQTLVVAEGRHQLINAYNDVLLELTNHHRQWTQFLRNVWQFDGFETIVAKTPRDLQAANGLRDRWMQDGLSARAFHSQELQSIVTAEFVSRHGDDMRVLLVDDCLELTRKVAQLCVQQLFDLVGLLSVGVVQWYPGGTCRYLFFRRGFYADSTEDTPTNYIVKGRAIGEVECHEHHLMDAFACHPANAPTALPASIQQLIEQAPSWLSSQLQLVNGTLTQESVKKLVVRDETWQIVRRVPRMHNDPALVIGPFVLAGWGPSDEEEGARGRGSSIDIGRLQPAPKPGLAPLMKKLLGGA